MDYAVCINPSFLALVMHWIWSAFQGKRMHHVRLIVLCIIAAMLSACQSVQHRSTDAME